MIEVEEIQEQIEAALTHLICAIVSIQEQKVVVDLGEVAKVLSVMREGDIDNNAEIIHTYAAANKNTSPDLAISSKILKDLESETRDTIRLTDAMVTFRKQVGDLAVEGFDAPDYGGFQHPMFAGFAPNYSEGINFEQGRHLQASYVILVHALSKTLFKKVKLLSEEVADKKVIYAALQNVFSNMFDEEKSSQSERVKGRSEVAQCQHRDSPAPAVAPASHTTCWSFLSGIISALLAYLSSLCSRLSPRSAYPHRDNAESPHAQRTTVYPAGVVGQ